MSDAAAPSTTGAGRDATASRTGAVEIAGRRRKGGRRRIHACVDHDRCVHRRGFDRRISTRGWQPPLRQPPPQRPHRVEPRRRRKWTSRTASPQVHRAGRQPARLDRWRRAPPPAGWASPHTAAPASARWPARARAASPRSPWRLQRPLSLRPCLTTTAARNSPRRLRRRSAIEGPAADEPSIVGPVGAETPGTNAGRR